MIVKYFAYFRDQTHCKEEFFSFGSLSALQLLINIGEKYGKTLSSQLLTEDKQRINSDVIFLINGRNIDFIDGENSKIEETDLVSLFPRIAGG